MALYVGPHGDEVDAIQITDDITFPSGTVGKKGEWVVRFTGRPGTVYEADKFVADFRQKFPRSAEPNESRAITANWVA